MKKINIIPVKQFLFAFICLFSLDSCEKSGPVGPQGEPGNSGADGSTIYNGLGMPNHDVGNLGDYYLDKKGANLYGPKTTSGWGSPLNLRGDDGVPGTPGNPGSYIFSGEGSPEISMGTVNDFYFDRTDAMFYGPKSESGWGMPISLRPANSNGAKIVIIKNHKFNEVGIEENYEWGFRGYLKSSIIPVPDYADYYDNGIVLVYVRFPNDMDSSWSMIPDGYIPINYSFLNGDLVASHQSERSAVKYGRNDITINGFYIYTYHYNSETRTYYEPEENIQELVGEHVIENLIYDLKFVLISGAQVSVMQRLNIDVYNLNAVKDFLEI
ncbi:hypothetical protein GCM10011386_36350 [Parapedobacter defluvii]|uniref:Collagen-like protein n=1 Tax=Parapedobacter defluvii TaxID=2045106 RepID=A0ABQ1MLX5_9SPHI|nr:collagen-like protein [Parapedobacter defluvii]GGC41053.1 hypothetical protein GCM10011386_36350 [Parapedobacter defluvii]